MRDLRGRLKRLSGVFDSEDDVTFKVTIISREERNAYLERVRRGEELPRPHVRWIGGFPDDDDRE